VSNILPCLPAQAGPDLNTLAAAVRTEHQAVGYAARNVLEHAMAAGDALIAARALVPEGRWGRWLRDHCDLSDRHARRYATLAAARAEIEARTRVSAPDLSLRGALKLIQKTRAPSSDSALPVEPKSATCVNDYAFNFRTTAPDRTSHRHGCGSLEVGGENKSHLRRSGPAPRARPRWRRGSSANEDSA
jgi:hypothetical protein